MEKWKSECEKVSGRSKLEITQVMDTGKVSVKSGQRLVLNV